MAGLERLTRMIYHEKQEAGSMLCAQHALNSLLQGSYFTAPDLSVIAGNLDALEESYDNSNSGNASTNMDDTGFFSIQVLDNALRVVGLNLTRWRGEEMRPYQDHPHTQLAFILNLEQHWFTLRRFGSNFHGVDMDPGDSHWFNLNSFLPSPEWVGKLYLGMVLQQAETDGYSVFAVTQVDPLAPLALPYTEADEIASTLPEPRSAARPSLQSLASSYTSAQSSSSVPQGSSAGIEGLEDEDYALQAALQASLMGDSLPNDVSEQPPIAPPRLARGVIPLPVADDPASASDSGTQTPTDGARPLLPPGLPPPEPDPVAASMERNRLTLQRMREQQEIAQRELWAENATGSDAAALEARRQQRRIDEENEAAQLRRAIEESEALARDEGHSRLTTEGMSSDIEIDPVMPQTAKPTGNVHVGTYVPGNRVYDDDDAELQAALKASLEHVPEGWELPQLERHRIPATIPVQSAGVCPATNDLSNRDMEDVESILSDETSTTENLHSDAGSASTESVSVDELRRRRLARFGV